MPLDKASFLGGTPAPPAPVAKLDPAPRATPLTAEVGVSGIGISAGQVLEPVPALRDLTGRRGRFLFAEMAEEDATVGACIAAIRLVVLGAKWRVDPADASPEAQAEADFVQGVLFEDMSHSWQDALGDALAMVTYGFSPTEIVWKRRVGPDQKDPARRSAYTDGRVGVRKLAGRHPLSVYGWQTDDAGGVQALIQQPPLSGAQIVIPIERLLLFRTGRNFGSPEGSSLLVSSRRPWAEKRHIGQLEVTGIDRDLTGLPLMKAPAEVLAAATPADQARLAAAKSLVEGVKAGRNTGILLSSEPYRDADGKPTGSTLWEFATVGSPGTKPVDVDKAQARRSSEIMTAFFTQFLLLGSGSRGGNRALSEDQSDFFLQSVTWLLAVIKETVNRHLLPRLWALNGLAPELMPTLEHDPVAHVALGSVAAMLTAMGANGAPIGGDVEAVNFVRRLIGMPEEQAEDPRAGAELPGADDPPEDPEDVVA